MIAEDFAPGGLRPRSETAGQASAAPRQLIIDWITRLWPSSSRIAQPDRAIQPRWAPRNHPARSPCHHGRRAARTQAARPHPWARAGARLTAPDRGTWLDTGPRRTSAKPALYRAAHWRSP